MKECIAQMISVIRSKASDEMLYFPWPGDSKLTPSESILLGLLISEIVDNDAEGWLCLDNALHVMRRHLAPKKAFKCLGVLNDRKFIELNLSDHLFKLNWESLYAVRRQSDE